MGARLLIDGDILAFRAAASHQSSLNFDDAEPPVITIDEKGARKFIDDELDWLVAKLKADSFLICLSDDFDNFRKQVWPGYKGHRTGERPQDLYPIKDWMMERRNAVREPSLEADDLMGILATRPYPTKQIIVSQDKDMRTVPGYLFRPEDPKAKVLKITPQEAARYHLYQTLIGDSTDGYKGCPGIGPVKAEKILGDLEGVAAWEAVVETYAARGLREADALQQARLAFILHGSHYEDNRVRLWTPPVD